MAAITQQDESIAVRFWRTQMTAHPTLAGVLSVLGSAISFVLNGRLLVWLAQWVIRVSGYVAESALLFAVLWISATSVAPSLIELVMSEDTMKYFVSFALIVLALIPEIILGNAIITVIDHWRRAALDKENFWGWMWAVLFTVPTLLFLWLTAVTINTLANNDGNFVQASTDLVNLRCFAGWGYGLLAIVYAGIGKRTQNFTPILDVNSVSPASVDYGILAEKVGELLAPQIAQIQTNLVAKIPVVDYQKITSTVLANLPQNVPVSEEEIVQKVVNSLQENQADLSTKIDQKIAMVQEDFTAKIGEISAKNQKTQSAIPGQKSNENLLWTPSKNTPKTEGIFDQFGQVLQGKTSKKNTDPGLKIVPKSPTTQPLNSPENAAKNLIGLTYQDATKLSICQKKNIKVSDIKAAIKSGDLKAKSDGSVAKSAIENWARNFREKVS